MKLDQKIKLGLGLLIPQTLFGAFSAKAEKNERPNIVFIEVDDLNYEYLGCFGSKFNQTPNVDQLAKDGVLFANATCQGMMSGPSRNSLMTGLYPHNLGFYYNGDMKSLPKDVWTFPKALQSAGYYTSWVGKCHIRPFLVNKDKTEAMRSQMGFDFVRQTMGRTVLGGEAGEGMDDNENAGKAAKGGGKKAAKADPDKQEKRQARQQRTQEEDWYMGYLKQTGYLNQFMTEFPKTSTLPEDVYLDGFFSKTAIDFIQGYNEKKPLFMWVNYSVPHEPYDVAEQYHTPYQAQNMPGTTRTDFTAPAELIRKTKPVKSEKDAKELQAGFSASIAFMDRQVGRLVQSLKEKGLYDNTIIVFFSDQGVMMGDHRLEHKGTLYRQITNPSLIVSFPKAFKRGLTNHSAVELIDLIRTTMEVANAKTSDREYIKTSYSLLPVLKGEKTKVRDYGFGENDGYVVVTDGRYRYIKGQDASLLFDDSKDPKNLHNIANENPTIVKTMSAEIDKWFMTTGKPLPRKSM